MSLGLSSVVPCRVRSNSQNEEEETLIKYFFRHHKANSRQGVYVEIGALDGVMFSNTLKLHNCFGWKGILIEGLLTNYKKLVKNMPRVRPKNVDIFHGAVCAPPETNVTFLTAQHVATGGDQSQLTDQFKKTFMNANAASTTVPCHPMSYYLKKYHHIDLFSLDIEGSELTALETMDFTRVHVDVFLIEVDGFNLSKNYKLRQYMFNVGFVECLNILHNSALFLNKNATNPGYKCPGQSTDEAFPDAATLTPYNLKKKENDGA